jgi:hypothetical protein
MPTIAFFMTISSKRALRAVTWLILLSISLKVDLGARFEQAGRQNLCARDVWRRLCPCARRWKQHWTLDAAWY